MAKNLERLIEVIFLGIIQGLTEWLPISSTGHLILIQYFLSLDIPLLFDVILHIGTLFVVLIFFRQDIQKTLLAFTDLDFKTEHGQLIPQIIVGTIPTVLIGAFFGKIITNLVQNIFCIAIAFILCGAILYSTKARKKEKINDINFFTALTIGAAQGLAIFPGISRSGTTIAVAILLGIKREKAFKFSFLLSIPVILGALGFTIHEQLNELVATKLNWTIIFVGVTTTIIVSFFVLKFFKKILVMKKLYLFAFYCWALGLILIGISF